MPRLNIVVEGQTELGFASSVLTPHLSGCGVYPRARCVETVRSKSRRRRLPGSPSQYRGGISKYEKLKWDISRWMKEDQNPDVFFTTMIDLYRLPRDFPALEEANRIGDSTQKVEMLEKAMSENIDEHRFIPYIQLHEFEALLLTKPDEFSSFYLEESQAANIKNLVDLASGFESPEEINDRPETSPSKRIITEIPEYEGQKAQAGPTIAKRIGIDLMMEKCPHFRQWVKRLEALAT